MPESRRNLTLLLAVLLLAATALLYGSAVHHSFLNYDDPDYVTRNPDVLRGLTWKGVLWSFGTNNPAANWHPLTWMSHMLDVSWYGTNPSGHHFTNVALHCLGVVLLFVFLARVTGNPLRSAAVAALFAVHPLNVESVAWVAERKAVLCMVFLLLTMLAYVDYVRKRSIGRYLLVVLLFALALMSKIMVITLPFALIMLDYWPLHRIPSLRRRGADSGAQPAQSESPSFLHAFRASVVEKIPLFLMSAAAGWITLRIHRAEGALAGAMPLGWRLKNATYSYMAYLGKAVWPSNLSAFYPHPENSLSALAVAMAAVLILAITVLVWRFRDKGYLVFGWLWFLGTMVPMGGIVQSGRQGMADRYIYIPILGLLIALIWLLADAAERFQIRLFVTAICFAMVAGSYAYAAHLQIGYWRDSYTLFGHALQVTRNNGLAENNFGAALMELGHPQLAGQHFVAAVRLTPDDTSAHYNLGVVLQGQNQFDAAVQQYKFVIAKSIDPLERTRAHNNLGVLYLATNNFPAALAELNAAIALSPTEQNSYIGRGIVEFRSSNLEAAIADFTRAAQIAPSPIAEFHLGEAFEHKGDYPSAELAYAAALRIVPAWTEARVRLEALHGKSDPLRQKPGGAE